ncbi:head-tail adaptor protein [Hymenobacter sp. HD11105]
MTLGLLDRRFDLLRPVPQPPDSFGATAPQLTQYALVATVSGGLRADTSQGQQEVFEAEQRVQLQRELMTIRFRRDVQASWLVIYQGQVYQLLAVNEIGRKQGLLLRAVSRGQVPESALPPVNAPSGGFGTYTFDFALS